MRTNEIKKNYKEWLVAHGFGEKASFYYVDTYAHMARIITIRSFALIYKLLIHQMYESAFLHGDIGKEIYMTQPEGFVIWSKKEKVCKLVWSLYRLKKYPNSAMKIFYSIIFSFGLQANEPLLQKRVTNLFFFLFTLTTLLFLLLILI